MNDKQRGTKAKAETILEEKDMMQERDDLDSIFGDLTTAYTVKVYRNDPDWCSGFLGEFHVGVGRSLSIQEVKNRFGGRVFDLRVYSGVRGGIAKRTTIVIDDVPRRDGLEINRDGTTKQKEPANTPKETIESSADPFEEIFSLNASPQLKRKLLMMQMGINGFAQPEQPKQDHNERLKGEMQLQQMMMEMQNQARQSSMQMMQQQFEMNKTMMQTRRELEDSATKPNPLNDVDKMIALVSKINGIKGELGGGHESLAGQVLEQTVPLIESAMMEFLSYKKLVAQNELKKSTFQQRPPQVDLPPRLPVATPQAAPGNSPKEMAAQMAKMYAGLSPQEQSEVMQTFMGYLEEPSESNEIIETNVSNDIIEDENEMLSDEDKALLNGNNENEAGNFSNIEYTGTTEDDDPPDRSSD